jgi:beta-lactamase superfamily II metal-dependent hydrolase
MYDGIEIDMLSLGDADCIIVTQWTAHLGPQRILIDGGNASDFPVVKGFLLGKGMTDFWAVVSSHLHGDHASGLIKLVQDPSFKIRTAWMHDVRNHMTENALRLASSGDSQDAKGVKEVWESTKELASAFAARGVPTHEPFAFEKIADYPLMTVLGPDRAFYKQTIEEFTKVRVPRPPSYLPLPLGAGLGRNVPLSSSLYAAAAAPTPLGNLYAPTIGYAPAAVPLLPLLSPLSGALRNSSVEESPSTQPYNNTSVILGVVFNGNRFMLTADAGSDALDRVPAAWKSLSWMQVPHHGSDGNLSQTNIERFCPTTAYVSACGDKSHPDSAIVNGLIKVRGTVYSTHTQGHLHHHVGSVPPRSDYIPAVPLKGTAHPVLPGLLGFGKMSDMMR